MNGNSRSWRTSSTRFHFRRGARSPEIASRPMSVDVPVTVMSRRLRLTDHDELSVRCGQYLDGRAVEPSQRRTCDDVARTAGRDAACRDVDDPIEVSEDRIDVVRDHHHRDALVMADPRDERGYRALVGEV